jgi:hypothetical protein
MHEMMRGLGLYPLVNTLKKIVIFFIKFSQIYTKKFINFFNIEREGGREEEGM